MLNKNKKGEEYLCCVDGHALFYFIFGNGIHLKIYKCWWEGVGTEATLKW